MEWANKALHPTMASAWAYAAGLFQNNQTHLKVHYEIPNTVKSPDDPLNAKALQEARFKGMDKDSYRGLGTRISPDELGRVLEVFVLHATKAQKPGINLKLANAAIETYEAEKLKIKAEKAVKKI